MEDQLQVIGTEGTQDYTTAARWSCDTILVSVGGSKSEVLRRYQATSLVWVLALSTQLGNLLA